MPTTMARYGAEYQTFIRRLRVARKRAGLSQEEAARKLGKPQSYVSKCESGERRVDIVEAAAFARLYGVRLASFVGSG